MRTCACLIALCPLLVSLSSLPVRAGVPPKYITLQYKMIEKGETYDGPLTLRRYWLLQIDTSQGEALNKVVIVDIDRKLKQYRYYETDRRIFPFGYMVADEGILLVGEPDKIKLSGEYLGQKFSVELSSYARRLAGAHVDSDTAWLHEWFYSRKCKMKFDKKGTQHYFNDGDVKLDDVLDHLVRILENKKGYRRVQMEQGEAIALLTRGFRPVAEGAGERADRTDRRCEAARARSLGRELEVRTDNHGAP